MNITIPDFNTVCALIIGDVMLDRYWHGTTSRISPEAPVPVVHIKQQQERPGGAGNVALNIAALGGKVTLISVTGVDEAAAHIIEQLNSAGVLCDFIQLPTIPTVTKLRVLSRHQQLIRLDFEEGFHNLDSLLISAKMQAHLNDANVVILSDYGKGVLVDPQTLIALARTANKPILIDPKGRDFEKYRNATVITPNCAEFEAVVGSCATQEILVERGYALLNSLNLEALLITRSEKGMTLLQRGQKALHLPAYKQEVYDVTGAGDTVIATLGAALAANQSWINATALANLAASLTVTKLGAATVTAPELHHALYMESGQDIKDKDSLLSVVNIAKAKGEKIVMTNGCFDILHQGHVHYLSKARKLGNRLIVAVNDDDSVRRLKGKERPINTLEQRMAVLNALSCVDWVVPFSEDTPKDLICQILPDILVKGGDYQIHDIAGSECVLSNGGQVLVLDFVDNCSTTRIIQALRAGKGKEI
jgi:D-beta-D-heptose 7-phosphate kinase/D-beta-D-heptose 1-phosphate adenosyltransferase